MSSFQYLSLGLLGVLLVVLGLVCFYDIGIIERGKESISRMIFLASQADPIIAVVISGPIFWIIGALCGHWWFPISK